MLIILILCIAIIFTVLIYNRRSLLLHTIVAFISLVILMLWYNIESYTLIITVSVFLFLSLIINIPTLRRVLLTNHILKIYRRNMPTISSTEEEAIEAGTVWWDGELFSGDPDWKKLMALPPPELSKKEIAFLEGPVEELCSMLDDWQITQELQDLPEEAWEFIKSKGFFGMIIPEKYGGLEFSAQAHSAVVMKIASRSTSAAVTVMVPNSLGPAELLIKYGTKEQKDYYLPRLAIGEEVPCFGLTGPDAGSDASSIPDNGILSRGEYNGKKDVLGIRLNWEKRYITLGPIATVLGLAFRLYDPDHLIGEKDDIGITLALIPTDTQGIRIGSRHFPLDAAFQVGPNWGKDVFIPIDFIIGGQKGAGEGWRMLMDCLAEGRSISLPALSTAGAKLTSRFIGNYSRIRKQFNMPIGRFEGVEEKLAEIAGYTYIADAARDMTAIGVDQGEEPAVVSAIVKYHLTELMRQVITNAMDIRGGSGICLGPRNLLGRIYQSIPISITVEGANILTRNMIIFGQGAIRGHPYLLKEINAARNDNEKQGQKDFDLAFMGHVGFIISNKVRSLILGLTGSMLVKTAGSDYSGKYLKDLTRMSSAFAFTSDITMIMLGAELKRKERMSARLADVLSYMYLASAAIKRYEDDGHRDEDKPLMDWACQFSLNKIQESFYDLFDNYPNKVIAFIMRKTIFPLGKSFKAPSDRLDHRVANILLEPSETRDRLTNGIFIPSDPEEALGRTEEAMKLVIQAEQIEKKLEKAVKEGEIKRDFKIEELHEAIKKTIITNDEASILKAAIEIRNEVIRVDDFPKDKWRR